MLKDRCAATLETQTPNNNVVYQEEGTYEEVDLKDIGKKNKKKKTD